MNNITVLTTNETNMSESEKKSLRKVQASWLISQLSELDDKQELDDYTLIYSLLLISGEGASYRTSDNRTFELINGKLTEI